MLHVCANMHIFCFYNLVVAPTHSPYFIMFRRQWTWVFKGSEHCVVINCLASVRSLCLVALNSACREARSPLPPIMLLDQISREICSVMYPASFTLSTRSWWASSINVSSWQSIPGATVAGRRHCRNGMTGRTCMIVEAADQGDSKQGKCTRVLSIFNTITS